MFDRKFSKPALLMLLTSLLISCRSPCPVSSLPSPLALTPPAEVRVTPARPPCNLPPLPQPFKFVGIPDLDGADRIYVTKSDLAELAVYLVAQRGWIAAATACLEDEP